LATERYRIRQQQSKEIIEKFRYWLEKAQQNTPQKPHRLRQCSILIICGCGLSPTWIIAVGLLLTTVPKNSIRPLLLVEISFSASQAGAHASANLYSLIETAKANNLEPYAYLREIFTLLPQAQLFNDIDMLLPWNINPVIG